MPSSQIRRLNNIQTFLFLHLISLLFCDRSTKVNFDTSLSDQCLSWTDIYSAWSFSTSSSSPSSSSSWSSLPSDSNRLKCPGTTLLKSNQAWVMRRVIGPLPPGQGQSLEDMIDHDRSTMAGWCQRGGTAAHGPPPPLPEPPSLHSEARTFSSAVRQQLNTNITRMCLRTCTQLTTQRRSSGQE